MRLRFGQRCGIRLLPRRVLHHMYMHMAAVQWDMPSLQFSSAGISIAAAVVADAPVAVAAADDAVASNARGFAELKSLHAEARNAEEEVVTIADKLHSLQQQLQYTVLFTPAQLITSTAAMEIVTQHLQAQWKDVLIIVSAPVSVVVDRCRCCPRQPGSRTPTNSYSTNTRLVRSSSAAATGWMRNVPTSCMTPSPAS